MTAALRPTLADLTFVCPDCRCPLDLGELVLHCGRCARDFPVTDGRVDFVGAPPPAEPVAPATGGALRRWLAALPPHPGRWSEPVDSGITNDNGAVRRFLLEFGGEGPVLDLGSGSRRLDAGLVTSDIEAWPEVDVVADAHHLPFADAIFSAVVLQEVIEHVDDPPTVLAEARRVLRGGGAIYVEAPFIYPEHARADYRRWTRRGLELEVGRQFEVIESGTAMPAASALSITWRAFIEDRMRGAHWAIRNLVTWSTAWIRRLDGAGDPAARAYACAFVIGRRP